MYKAAQLRVVSKMYDFLDVSAAFDTIYHDIVR